MHQLNENFQGSLPVTGVPSPRPPPLSHLLSALPLETDGSRHRQPILTLHCPRVKAGQGQMEFANKSSLALCPFLCLEASRRSNQKKKKRATIMITNEPMVIDWLVSCREGSSVSQAGWGPPQFYLGPLGSAKIDSCNL